MKITKSQLKKIIKEELEQSNSRVLLTEAMPTKKKLQQKLKTLNEKLDVLLDFIQAGDVADEFEELQAFHDVMAAFVDIEEFVKKTA